MVRITVERLHYVGVAGSGMSALAQYHALGGGGASGSDRSFDRGQAASVRSKLEALGVRIAPQDGSAIRPGAVDAVIASTAIESDNADLEAARRLKVSVVHRADQLARYVRESRAIAVAGTSGKSTVAAMVFEILAAAGLDPSVITGGGLRALESRGLIGNAWRGRSDLLVIEADESDGTLVRYAPWLGVLLNVDRDHKEVPELVRMFSEFRGRCRRLVIHHGYPGFDELQKGARTFGLAAGADIRGEDVQLGPDRSTFRVATTRFRLPAPGRYNVENALAAIAASVEAGASLDACASALERFQGVARRFEAVGETGGVRVIDDFAHNPAKVRAALGAARLQAPRILAVFQPHGFAPTRFNRDEFIEAFASSLRPGDVLLMPEIYYAGGTADRSISSRDIVGPVSGRGVDARFIERPAIPAAVAAEAKPGDLVLVMGARDPSLPELARAILEALETRSRTP